MGANFTGTGREDAKGAGEDVSGEGVGKGRSLTGWFGSLAGELQPCRCRCLVLGR